MPDSRVVNVVRAHRLAMSAKEAETMREMAVRWMGVERAIDGNIAALANEMLRRTQAGEVITPSMIRAANRYEILKAQTEREILKYNKDAAVIISDGQVTALEQGLSTAQDAIVSSAGFNADYHKINVGAVDAMVGFAGDGSPLVNLLNESVSAGATDSIVQSLIDGIGQGLGAEQVARDIAASINADQIAKGIIGDLGKNFDRSLVIARTEINRSYRSASTEQYRQSGVTDGFMRLVARDEACIACLALDGEKFDSPDEMDDHPNGRCTCVPIIAGMDDPQWQHADAWLAEQPESRQREILGNTRFEMFKNGTPLSAFAEKKQDDIWGASPRIIPLRDLDTGGIVAPKVDDLPPSPAPFSAEDLRNDLLKFGESDIERTLQIQDVANQRNELLSQRDIINNEINNLHRLTFAPLTTAEERIIISQKIDALWLEKRPLTEAITALAKQEKELIKSAAADARKLLAVENPVNTKITGNLKSINEVLSDKQEVFNLVDAGVIKGENSVEVVFRNGRAHYGNTQNQIVITKSDGVKIFAHEFGHFIEDEGKLRQIANDYLNSRTAGEQAKSLRKLTGIKGYKAWEVAKPDKFKSPYMGKIYPSGDTEIISMGLEWLYDDPIGFAKTDPDYFDFMVRTLRGK